MPSDNTIYFLNNFSVIRSMPFYSLLLNKNATHRRKRQFHKQNLCEVFRMRLAFLLIFVYNVLCKMLSMRRCDMNGIKGYISIREASYRWGVSERRVNQYCAEGRIPGTSRFGRSWAIPENAEKPADPRKAKISKTIRRYAPCQNRNGI